MAPYPIRPLPHLPPLRELYRAYLRNLRYIPDPHVWAQLVPRYKRLLRGLRVPLPAIPAVGSEGARSGLHDAGDFNEKGKGRATELDDTCQSQVGAVGKETNIAELWEDYARARELRFRDIRKAKTDLRQVRQAAAVHPHALLRLLDQAYGQRGKIRWELMKNITNSSPLPSRDWPALLPPHAPIYPPRMHQPLPPALRDLTEAFPELAKRERLRPLAPVRVQKAAEKKWHWDWDTAGVPLSLPANSHNTATGWEHLRLEETIRIIAGLDQGPVVGGLPKRLRKAESTEAATDTPSLLTPRTLPTYTALPASLAAVFPKFLRLGSPDDAFPKPRPALIRSNPHLWKEPRRMDMRMLRRMYRRFDEKLPRVYVASEAANPRYVAEAEAASAAFSSDAPASSPTPPAASPTAAAAAGTTTAPAPSTAYPEPPTSLIWARRKRSPADARTTLAAKYVQATPEEKAWFAKSAEYTALLVKRERIAAGAAAGRVVRKPKLMRGGVAAMKRESEGEREGGDEGEVGVETSREERKSSAGRVKVAEDKEETKGKVNQGEKETHTEPIKRPRARPQLPVSTTDMPAADPAEQATPKEKEEKEETESPEPQPEPPKRPRGRPRKVPVPATDTTTEAGAKLAQATTTTAPATEAESAANPEPPKRKRGRPRKNPLPDA